MELIRQRPTPKQVVTPTDAPLLEKFGSSVRFGDKLPQVPVFSFHLAKATLSTTVGALLDPPTTDSVTGLCHAECMTVMALGSPILSSARMQLKRLHDDTLLSCEALVAGEELCRVLPANASRKGLRSMIVRVDDKLHGLHLGLLLDAHCERRSQP